MECSRHIVHRYPTLTLNNECLPPYAKNDEEVKNFNSLWQPADNKTRGDTLTGFLHGSTPASKYWGELSTYPGSGYTQPMGHSHNKADGYLKELVKNRLVNSSISKKSVTHRLTWWIRCTMCLLIRHINVCNDGWPSNFEYFCKDDSVYINTLWPSYAIWRQNSGSTMTKVLTRCLTTLPEPMLTFQ